MLKRVFDITASLIGFILISPLFLLLIVLIRITMGSPVFFLQKRLGKDGVVFNIIKFRTMIIGAENTGTGIKTSKEDPRITRIGKYLRKFSLDELPQLINIIKGEMSIVGPRPAPIHHLQSYSNTQRKRLVVKPGITGLAQVNGRNTIPWGKRIVYDVIYVERNTLWMDVKIIAKTIMIVFQKKGIYSK